jgi:hypothetical protein
MDVSKAGVTRYVVQDGLRVLAYRRDGERIRFFLDRSVYADCVRRWLPEVEGYAAGMINHLLRVRLELGVAEQMVTIVPTGLGGQLEAGLKLHVLAEDGEGSRKEIAATAFSTSPMGPFSVPAGTRKVAAFVRGLDQGGRFVAVAEVGL